MIRGLRRLIVAFAMTVAMLTGTLCADAESGGPDTFGYSWRDSNEPGGPTFLWNDINGVVLNLSNELVAGPLPIGFDFPLYGATFKNVWISANGWLSLTQPSGDLPDNVDLGDPNNSAPPHLIAPFWDDLVSTQVNYQSDGTRFIVTWENARHHDNGSCRARFQAILFPSGRIVFQYSDMVPCTPAGTIGATIGIQGAAAPGLLVSFNDFPVGDRAIELRTPLCAIEANPVAAATVDAGGSASMTYSIDSPVCGMRLEAGLSHPLVSPSNATITSVSLSWTKTTSSPGSPAKLMVTVSPEGCSTSETYISDLVFSGATNDGLSRATASVPIVVNVRAKAVAPQPVTQVAAEPGNQVQFEVNLANNGFTDIVAGDLSTEPVGLAFTNHVDPRPGAAIPIVSVDPPPASIGIPYGHSQLFHVTVNLPARQKAGLYLGSLAWQVCHRPMAIQSLPLEVVALPSFKLSTAASQIGCGGASPSEVTITNDGNTELNVTATAVGNNPLVVTPNQLPVPYGGTATVRISTDQACSDINPGVHPNRVDFDGNGPLVKLPVTVNVEAVAMFEIVSPPRKVAPGQGANIVIGLTNRGNIAFDDVKISSARNFRRRGANDAAEIPFPPVPFALGRLLGVGANDRSGDITVPVAVGSGFFAGSYESEVTLEAVQAQSGRTVRVNAVLELQVGGTSNRLIAFSNNPVRFSQAHQVTIAIAGASGASIKIYTMMGVLVRSLEAAPSSGYVAWDLTNNNGELVASGAYIVTCNMGGQTYREKLLVVK